MTHEVDRDYWISIRQQCIMLTQQHMQQEQLYCVFHREDDTMLPIICLNQICASPGQSVDR